MKTGRPAVCPAGHRMEESWDVCPYCAGGGSARDLAETRVHVADHTIVLRSPTAGIPMIGWLVALSGGHRGEAFPLAEGRNAIGKDAGSTVRLLDDGVSETHARIVSDPLSGEAQHILMDLDSTNGTFLNDAGRRVDREEIVDNDLIRFGSTEMIFKTLPKGAIARLRE